MEVPTVREKVLFEPELPEELTTLIGIDDVLLDGAVIAPRVGVFHRTPSNVEA